MCEYIQIKQKIKEPILFKSKYFQSANSMAVLKTE